jgi:hypothetical protein
MCLESLTVGLAAQAVALAAVKAAEPAWATALEARVKGWGLRARATALEARVKGWGLRARATALAAKGLGLN